MSATSVCAFLLACLAVSVQSYGVRLCPSDADIKLDDCLSTLEHSARMGLPENCGPAMEALRCSKMLLRACMNSDNAGIFKVLANYDLSSMFRVKPLCLGQ